MAYGCVSTALLVLVSFGTVVDARHCPRQRSSTRHVLADLTHACNFTRLHLKMTDTLPHAASADKRARTASSDRGSGRLGRRSALGALGVLGAALMAPQRAEAGFGPGVSTTISPPPVESLNLDQFLNLSERKRLQRAQLPAILRDDAARAARIVRIRQDGGDAPPVSAMRALDAAPASKPAPPKPAKEPSAKRPRKTPSEQRKAFSFVRKKKQKEVAASEEEKRLALEKQLKARQDTLDALEAQPAWVRVLTETC